jgi:hypothetical protein
MLKRELSRFKEVIFGHSMAVKDGIVHIRYYRPVEGYAPGNNEELYVDGKHVRYVVTKEGGSCHRCAFETDSYCTGVACSSGHYAFVDEKLEAEARAASKKREAEYNKWL